MSGLGSILISPLRRRRRRPDEPLHDAGDRRSGGPRGLLGGRAGAERLRRRVPARWRLLLEEGEDGLLLLPPPRLHRGREGAGSFERARLGRERRWSELENERGTRMGRGDQTREMELSGGIPERETELW